MKLRNDEIKKLEQCISDLNLDIQTIMQEHEHCVFDGSNEEVMSWFHSLPIETLSESIGFDTGKPRSKYSLTDMKHQFALRKLHREKVDQLQVKQTELSIAKIDSILSDIESIK